MYSALLNLLILLLLGASLYLPNYLPKQQINAYGNSFSLVTFNVSETNELLAHVIEWLKCERANIIMLQEVNSDSVNTLITDLRPLYPFFNAISTEDDSRTNIIFSVFPLYEREQKLTPDVSSFPSVEVNIAGNPLVLYNISLFAPVSQNKDYSSTTGIRLLNLAFAYDENVRNEQLFQLLSQVRHEFYPLIIAGDFNLSDQSWVYGRVAQVLQDSYKEVGNNAGFSWPAYYSGPLQDVFFPLIRIDYIWHSSQLTAINARMGPQLGSDHLPIVSSFTNQ